MHKGTFAAKPASQSPQAFASPGKTAHLRPGKDQLDRQCLGCSLAYLILLVVPTPSFTHMLLLWILAAELVAANQAS